MNLSQRLSALKPSPTVALNTKAQQLARAGQRVINFTVGEPDISTPPSIVRKCIESLERGRTKYGQPGGGDELRHAIAHKLLRDNHLTFAPETIVAGIGAKEILFHTFMALLNEGNEVLIPAPYWVSYPEQVKAAGGVPIEVPPGRDLRVDPINLDQLEKLSTNRTVAIVLNSPNNPAGYVFSAAFSQRLADFLRRKSWWIIADEIYEYLSFDRPHVSLLEICPELADRFILINGMSKAFAMTGWRVGYGAGPLSVMKLVRAMQSHSSTCLPGFIEDATTFALGEGKPLMADGIASIRERRDYALNAMAQIKGVTCTHPDGAFYIFMDLRKRLAPLGKSSLQFCDELLTNHQVALVPGEAFGCSGFARLSYTTSKENISEGMGKIALGLAQP